MMPRICVSDWVSIGSGNGLLPVRRQAITRSQTSLFHVPKASLIMKHDTSARCRASRSVKQSKVRQGNEPDSASIVNISIAVSIANRNYKAFHQFIYNVILTTVSILRRPLEYTTTPLTPATGIFRYWNNKIVGANIIQLEIFNHAGIKKYGTSIYRFFY